MDSKTKNTLALSLVALVVFIFFISGIFGVMHYAIIKYAIIGIATGLGLTIAVVLFNSSLKKNHPENEFQDDSN